MPTRRASAAWEGGLRSGKGSYKTASGLVGGTYGFGSRFEEAPGSNPEELLAAAHAACFSMALSAGLERAGTIPTRVATDAACTVEKVGDAFKITKMKLVVRGKVPGMDQAAFLAAAEAALAGCPVSGALKGNVAFELDAKLE
jgi:osmotically inducible protein OsmC